MTISVDDSYFLLNKIELLDEKCMKMLQKISNIELLEKDKIMDAKQFVYWLHGFLSVPYLNSLTENDEHFREFNVIKNHLLDVLGELGNKVDSNKSY